ncbi:MAG: protein translocase subunit SecF [Actinomycetota bacterium]
MSVISAYRKMAKGESTYDFVGYAKRWFIISGTVVLIGVIGLFARGLNLNLAFRGGSSFQVPVAAGTHVTVPQVEGDMKQAGLASPLVQLITRSGSENIRVEAQSVTEQTRKNVLQSLTTVAGQTNPELVSVDSVGPTWGAEISKKALRALIVFLILVVIYISFRFEPKMAICATVALVHDVVATIGIYAIVGFQVSPATVIAYLTILGYSLYDSVVVFDKVRENQQFLTGTSRISYSQMVNKSVNQTVMRSINTSLSSLLPVGALLFVGVYVFGADTLKDLALALFIGITVGSYSSIFLGPPLLAIMKEKEPRYRQLAARARQAQGPVPVGAGAGAIGGSFAVTSSTPEDTSENGGETRTQRPTSHVRRPGQPRGRKQRGGKRKR